MTVFLFLSHYYEFACWKKPASQQVYNRYANIRTKAKIRPDCKGQKIGFFPEMILSSQVSKTIELCCFFYCLPCEQRWVENNSFSWFTSLRTTTKNRLVNLPLSSLNNSHTRNGLLILRESILPFGSHCFTIRVIVFPVLT